MPKTDFELQEPWFHLLAVTSFVFLPVVLAPIAKIARTCDKKAMMCKSPFRYIPGIFPVGFFSLAHLGLITTALFIHINESEPAKDRYFYEINILTYIVGLLMAFVPHIYTLNWYDYGKHKKYGYSKSWAIMSMISGLLTPLVIFIAWGLLLAAIAMVGYDDRWTAFGVYLAYEAILTVVFLYLVLELFWCANAYRRYSKKSGKSGFKVLIEMERDVMTSGQKRPDEESVEGFEMSGNRQQSRRYGAKKRRGYSPYEPY